MKILGELVEIEKGKLYIPWFHRVAPSLQSGSKVHCVLSGNSRPELYLSPFKWRSWTDIWRIHCEFIDRSGLFAQLTNLLGSRAINVNILAHESTTIRDIDQNTFQVTLICDLTGYGSPDNPDKQSQERAQDPNARIQFLCDYLTIQMLHDVRLHLGQPQIFATRLRELHSVGLRTKASNDDLEFTAVLQGGVLPIHDSIWHRLVFGQRLHDGKLLATVSTDTEDRFIRVGTLSPDKDAFLLEIRHTDREGAIANFAKLLNSRFKDDLNINCSYLRLKEAGGDALWRCLLEAQNGKAESLRKEIKEEFENFRWMFQDERLEIRWPAPISQRSEPLFGKAAPSRTKKRR